MAKNQLRIGLFGFGCVGYGLYEVLSLRPGLDAEIRRICVKDPSKKRAIDSHHFSYDKNDILNDPDINLVVELIDDAEAAFEIVRDALRKGKAVVSANKKMIAEHFDELLQLQHEYNASLLYEAAVCASVPIIRNLEEYYDNDLLESISGIVNGSTNYILSNIYKHHLSYPEALQQAQDQGYTESNPILDTGGYDAKYKLLILIAHAFGVVLRPQDLFHCGIQNLGAIDLKYAREKNLKIKLCAEAYRDNSGHLAAFVMPRFVSSESALFSVDDVYNGVLTRTALADTQFFVGKGAGAYPTASAVLSDISALRYGYRYEYKKLGSGERLRAASDVRLHVYCSAETTVLERVETFFDELEERYQNSSEGYCTGSISLAKLIELHHEFADQFAVVLLDTYESQQVQDLRNYQIQSQEFGLAVV